MKRTIKLAVAAAVVLTSTSAFATNGANLIALGAKSLGMGGTGVGISHGAESALANPALISSVKGTEVSFGGTVFMPDVETDMGGGAGYKQSGAGMSVIPEVSLASKVNDNFYAGIGMWGTAGMGVDYRMDQGASTMQMVTNLQLMQFGVPLAYTMNGFSVGITPVVQYGSLDINYYFGGATRGAGVGQDLSLGYVLGAAYEVSDLTLGLTYKSRIDMDFGSVLPSTVGPMTGGAYTNELLSTPAEFGVGASYKMGDSTVAVDYKKIKWSEAEAFKDFKWQDQDVIALGYEYQGSGWAARCGYNYATNPIKELGTSYATTANGLSYGVINTFNLLGFPGIAQSHYTVGGSYDFSKQVSVDAAYVYAPEVTESGVGFMGTVETTKMSQKSVTAQLNFKF